MYELYAMTAGEGLTLLLVVVAHGALIGYLVRRGWLAAPRPTLLAVPAPPEAPRSGRPARQERIAA